MAVSLKSAAELNLMREAGRHVAEVLHILAGMVRPGLVVADLDATVREEYARRGLTATFLHYQPHPEQPPYPSTVCVSINDQIVHGIPGARVLQDGDVVKLDLGATHRGYVGDSAITIGCGTLTPEAQQLIDVTDDSLRLAIEQSRAGGRLGDIGSVIQRRIEGCGMSVIKNYGGHGVGRSMHEEPFVANHGTPGTGRRLKPGMVIAIEPMATLGGDESWCADDGWTVATSDGSLASHFEHTVAITKNGPLILTAP